MSVLMIGFDSRDERYLGSRSRFARHLVVLNQQTNWWPAYNPLEACWTLRGWSRAQEGYRHLVPSGCRWKRTPPASEASRQGATSAKSLGTPLRAVIIPSRPFLHFVQSRARLTLARSLRSLARIPSRPYRS